MRIGNKMLSLCLVSILLVAQVAAADESNQSIHLGVFHPNGGLSMIGYSVESPLNDRLYWYYAFGFPTVAAAGITYYENRDGNGLTSTLGVSLASYAYVSAAYQLSLGNQRFLKLGVGASGGFAYDATVHPIIAWEQRF